MKKVLLSSLLGLFTFLTVLVAADTAAAQRPTWANRRYTRTTVDQAIKRVENSADALAEQLDRALDNTRLDGSSREDRIENAAEQLENATDELRREFDRNDQWWEVRENVSKSLAAARDLNRLLRDRRLNALSRNGWARVQRDLNALATYYRLPRV